MITHDSLDTKLDSIDESHFDLLLKWRNDPRIFKWCRQNDLINIISHRNWFQKQATDPKIKMYLIRDTEDKPIGVCGLTDMDLINRRAEFSLYINPELHGSGYGKDALTLLCYHAFNSYPLNVIWGESFDGNRAINTFEKIGFKKEGIRRDFYFRSGKHIDALLFSIKRNELVI